MKISLPAKIKQLFNRSPQVLTAGIALHSKAVRIVIGEVSNDQWHYQSHAEIAIDGEDAWLATIEELVKTHQLKGVQCSLSLPFNRYQLLQIDKPAIPDEELGRALPWTLKELVSIPQEDVVADYFHVAAKIPMQADKLNVVVVSRKFIMPLIKVFTSNKIDLQEIVPEELLIRNVVGGSDNAMLLLSQQYNEEIALQIVKQNRLYFARKLRGFNRIHDYSAEELTDGLNDSLSLEIQRSMDYFETQLKQARVKTIYLALPTVHQSVIAQGIASHFDLTVEVMGIRNDHINIDAGVEISEQFYPALGAALEFLAYDLEQRVGNGVAA